MPIRRLRTSNNNRRTLLENVGFRSIQGFRRENPEYRTNDSAYRVLLTLYNEEVDRLNAEEESERREQERLRREQERLRKVYLRTLQRQITLAERNNTRTEISINMDLLQNNFTYLLGILKPTIRKYLITVGDKLYTINTTTLEKLKKLFENDITLQMEEFESGNEILVAIQQRLPITLTILPLKFGGIQLQEGAFFPYTHNLDIDLNKYGVYKTGSNYGDKINDDNCLVSAFACAGYDTTRIKQFVKNQYIPMRNLKDVASKLKVYIVVKRVSSFKDTTKYGDPNDPIINLGLLEKHYFLIENVDYTSYSIKNYFDIKKKNDWERIYCKEGTKYKRKDRFITSYDLIKLLVDCKDTHLHLLTGVEIYKLIDYKNHEEKIYSSLEYNDTIKWFDPKVDSWINEDGDLMKNKPIHKNKKNVALDIIYFDFETTTKRNDGVATHHVPYCCYTDRKRQGYWGTDCGRQMLDDLVDTYYSDKVDEDDDEIFNHITLIAHNSGYDFRFLLEHLSRVETIEKGTGLMSAKCRYYKGKKWINIIIRDSLKMINMPLRNFGKSFKLDVKKEIMPYDLYTEENVITQHMSIDYCLSFIDDKDKIEYMLNCNNWGCVNDGCIDILKYAGEYCYMDCITLKKGYEAFRQLTFEATELDILDYITLASMSNDYLVRQGCYDDVLKICGIPRAFIQKCIVGGRTMTAENKKHHTKVDVADFDAVSLYPSGMSRMDGFLQGKPKIIEQFTPEKYDGYFICIRLKKINRHLKFPLCSYISDKGVRIFSNDMEEHVIYVDKTSLEDLIYYHQIEYEFINGYYYDEGHNPLIKETMKYLFTQRLKYKKEKNPIQMIFKELMNSSYGKSYMKPIDSDNRYVKIEEMDKFIDRNYNSIKEACLLHNGRYYKVCLSNPIDKHFNNAHVGVEILSITKRIMSEVMVLSEEMGFYIYYQDTDSIHIETKQIEPLANAFKEKYGRELIGIDMGQFHTDFDMDGAVGEIKATESIFLGKKCYIDKLQSVDKDNNIIHDHHIRMKGVPCDSIKYYAKNNNLTMMELYKKLYEGETITFDLLAVRPKFDMRKNMSIITKTKFDRDIKFRYEGQQIVV